MLVPLLSKPYIDVYIDEMYFAVDQPQKVKARNA